MTTVVVDGGLMTSREAAHDLLAARLGLPEKTVENRLFRGRRRLRQKLLERGVIL